MITDIQGHPVAQELPDISWKYPRHFIVIDSDKKLFILVIFVLEGSEAFQL